MPPRKHTLTSGIADIVETEAEPTQAITSPPNDATRLISESVTGGEVGAVKRGVTEAGVSAQRPALRPSRHHVSLYVSRKVDRAMKQIALDTGRRPHEVYLDAIRRELRDHGKDFDALTQED